MVTKPLPGHLAGTELCDALGIDWHNHSIIDLHIHVSAGSAVQASVIDVKTREHLFIDSEQWRRLVEITRRYELTPKSEQVRVIQDYAPKPQAGYDPNS